MLTRTIEHLPPERIEELWPEIEALLDAASEPEVGAPNSVTSDCLRIMAMNRVAHILGVFDGTKLDLILVFEFAVVSGVKTASISAMAGKGLLRFRSEFWQDILDWFRAAGARAVDAYARPRLARIYQEKFGFDQSCSYVRMAL